MKNMRRTREQVYEVIDGERDYQERETANPLRLDMVEDFDMSKALLAIKHITDQAVEVWYDESEETDYQLTMGYLRKITAIGVQMGERYVMPDRKS